MSFAERMAVATAFEQQVIDRLNNSGWCASSFGQAQLTAPFRERLRRFQDGCRRPSLIRWMPDVITYLDLSRDRALVALIDAKASGNRPNYSIEMSAIETAEIYTDSFYTPTFFVFDDWKVLTPREARQRGTTGPETSNGSGTPYVLVNKRWGRLFDEVFPPRNGMSS